MSLLHVIGLNGYTQTGTRREYTQDLGLSTVTKYKGPIDKIDDLFQSSQADVQNGIIDRVTTGAEDGEGVLELSVAEGGADDNDPSTIANNTIWELVGQDLFKNIRSYNGDVAGSQPFNVDGNQSVLEDARLYFETAKEQGTEPAGEPQETYYKLLLRGQDQYIRSAAVLRKSIQVSRRSLISGNWKGVDRAWKIDGEEGSPDLDRTGQGILIGEIEDLPGYNATSKQWLKRPPQITISGKKRYSLTQEWWFAQGWSTNMYGGGLAP